MSGRRGRVIRYRGRKQRLVELVRTLSERMDRPVCSVDLKEYLAGQEHHELGYIQALGQILIKAALVQPGGIPHLHAVGIFRNRTFYSADDNPRWNAAFMRFGACERAEYLHRQGFLQCLPSSGIRSTLECAAASSLRDIIEDTAGYMDPSLLRYRLDIWLSKHPRVRGAMPPFHGLSRKQALALLKRETSVRADYVPTMNYNRHLARVCPTFLRFGHSPVYCAEALHSYCVVQWPLRGENPDREAASLLQWILVMIAVARSESSPPA
jgi:hypothetical protein